VAASDVHRLAADAVPDRAAEAAAGSGALLLVHVSLIRPAGVGSKPQASEVERGELVVEVDVEPFVARRLRLLGGERDDAVADSPMLERPRVFVSIEECVAVAVADDVDEADEHAAASRAVTQPKLCGRIRSHQPARAGPV
jgi:hypothetical protein